MSAGSNQFGHLFRWTSFGESHGAGMGVVIDGCPSGLTVDYELLNANLKKRRPGAGGGTTSERKESDEPEILSGVFEGKTLGTPIAVIVKNRDQRSQDYEDVKKEARPGHADDLWKTKFGHWDHRGGGRASARETVNWVIAGSFAQMLCQTWDSELSVEAQLQQVGELKISSLDDPRLLEMLVSAKEQGESFGAIANVTIKNKKMGLGEPIFKKMKSELANAFFTLNAVCGVEFGDGFKMATQKGSAVHGKDKDPSVYGGLRGGMTTGEDISFQVAFKPTSSIGEFAKKGRHDPCVAMRALPILEALSWSVLADQMLMARLNQI